MNPGHTTVAQAPLSNLLIIRPSAMGDVARTVPALVSLRQAYPQARIDWLVDAGSEALITHHPALTAAIPFPKKQIKAALTRGTFSPLRTLLRTLRAANYDAVFDLQGLARSAAIACATGSARRYGRADARELAPLTYTTRISRGDQRHTVEQMLEIVCAAPGVVPVRDARLYTSPESRVWASTLGFDVSRAVVLAPTSRWPAKQWPAQRYAEVARTLASQGYPVAIIGAPGEEAQCAPLQSLVSSWNGAAPIADLVGTLSLERLMALIERSALVIANDSAPLHIAVGFGRPLVALFGPTRVERVGPYQREGDVLQHVTAKDTFDHKDPARRDMMERITVDEVLAAAFSRLDGSISRAGAQTPA